MAAQLFNRLGQLGVGLAVGGAVINNALYNVDGGHRAVIFDRFAGIKDQVVGEGTHFMIPWVQRPIIYDIRARPMNVPSVTGSKDLQNVNITLRILYRYVNPVWKLLKNLHHIYISVFVGLVPTVCPRFTPPLVWTMTRGCCPASPMRSSRPSWPSSTPGSSSRTGRR